MKRQFHDLYDDAYADEIRSLEDAFPDERSLRLDWQDLQAFDASLAESFRTSPWEAREAATDALRKRAPDLDAHDALDPYVRVNNLPEEHTYRVGKYRQQHLGQLLAAHGKVVGTDPVTPFAEVAAWRCAYDDCGAITRTEQSYGNMIPPNACAECERKGRESEFDFSHQQSDLVDHQEIAVIPADTAQNDPPAIPVHLKADLCDTVDKHYEIRVVGVYETFPAQKETVLNTYIEAFDLDVEEYAKVDSESASDLDDRIIQTIADHQQDGQWGVDPEYVVETVADATTPAKAVRERIEELKRDQSSDLREQGDRLMVI